MGLIGTPGWRAGRAIAFPDTRDRSIVSNSRRLASVSKFLAGGGSRSDGCSASMRRPVTDDARSPSARPLLPCATPRRKQIQRTAAPFPLGCVSVSIDSLTFTHSRAHLGGLRISAGAHKEAGSRFFVGFRRNVTSGRRRCAPIALPFHRTSRHSSQFSSASYLPRREHLLIPLGHDENHGQSLESSRKKCAEAFS